MIQCLQAAIERRASSVLANAFLFYFWANLSFHFANILDCLRITYEILVLFILLDF